MGLTEGEKEGSKEGRTKRGGEEGRRTPRAAEGGRKKSSLHGGGTMLELPSKIRRAR